MRASWKADVRGLTLAPDRAATLGDPRRYLFELIELLQKPAAVARLLDVDRAQITHWQRGESISSQMARRIVDAHAVLLRACSLFDPSVVPDWLDGSEPHLGGARPIDVLTMFGASRVLSALAAIESQAGIG
jgi:uncharacterized protein (DUF2384 family)